jgi:predicted phosphodiesterase/biotin operon repressor
MSKKKAAKEKLNCQTCPKANTKFDSSNPMVRSDVVKVLSKQKNKGMTLVDIANKLHLKEENVREVISYLLKRDGYNIQQGNDKYYLSDALPPLPHLSIQKLKGKEIKFGLLTDTHLCSKFARLDILEAAYDIFAKDGITEVFHAGNIIDGEFKYNRYEICAHGVHDQSNYLADYYPQRKGITTYFVTGDCHEGWYQKDCGLRIGWYMQNWCQNRGRNDLIHIGHIEQDVIFERPEGKFVMRIIHPGGGTPYAVSYTSQKMVESFQGGDKPDVLVMGHFHKFDVSYPREVLTIMPGCLQDQTTFMRKLKLKAEVGFCVCNLGIRQDGSLGKFGVEWFPFYDVAYHKQLELASLKM